MLGKTLRSRRSMLCNCEHVFASD